MPRSKPIVLAAGAVAVLLIILLGVLLLTRGGDDGDDTAAGTATTTVADTPEALLAAAGAQWDATDTAKFDLAIDGKAYIDNEQTLELRSASGVIARPDSVDAKAKIAVSLVVFDVGIIAIGDTMYQTNIVTGDWELAPEDFDYNPAILFSPEDGISALVDRVQGAAFAGEETVNGRSTRIVTGTLTGQDIKAITSGALTGDVINTRVWIASAPTDIVKVVLQAPADAGGTATIWTLTISGQNQPVEITAPELE